jgi:hypothetical protein
VSLLSALQHVAERAVATMERVVAFGHVTSWSRLLPKSCSHGYGRAML